MKSKINVILVDDHIVVRAGFRLLLTSSDSIHVIAEAERGEQAYITRAVTTQRNFSKERRLLIYQA